jgi:hypothetical protein
MKGKKSKPRTKSVTFDSYSDISEDNSAMQDDYSIEETTNSSGYTREDYENAERCRDDIRGGMTREERLNAAHNFGSNWANIMSGLGDQ